MDNQIEDRERSARIAVRKDVDSLQTDMLEFLEYQYQGKSITIATVTEEFTSVCPMTGLPDFGKITLVYKPSAHIVELKSLKYYLFQFREVGIFYEHIVNRIADDLHSGLAAESLEIIGEFTPRGGMQTTVTAHR